ncbi:MAG: ribosomal protein S18-alanine N-acetyltransferase [Aquificaceae bacterium]
MVREMQPSDLREVLKINEECFNSDAWSKKAFEKEFSLDYSYKFVLEEEGEIIGYVVVWQVYDEATIMSIAIKKEKWGKGYGKRLMEFIIGYFKGRVKRLVLDVRRSNIRAIRLYQSFGFKIVSERRGYYSDGEDAFQMMLELEEEGGDQGKALEVVNTGGKDT